MKTSCLASKMSQGSFYVFDLIYSGSMECLLTDILLLDATLT